MLKHLQLKNFRSYGEAEFEFGSKTVIVGSNGSGKSNIIEAAYLLSTGKSFRADADWEMVHYGDLVGLVTGRTVEDELRVTLTNGMPGVRKRFEVNGVGRRQVDFTGKLRSVLFGPWDLDLVNGSPSVRRRYLDFVLGQKDREYRRSLYAYEKGLRQRNRILERIREGMAGRNQLFYWDHLLIKNGEYLTLRRGFYLEELNNRAAVSPHQTGSKNQIHNFRIEYDKSVISESRIAQYENEEVAAAVTLVGPHRDNFVVNQKTFDNQFKDVAKFGSRGEQRMAVFWLKLAERDFLTEENHKPVLLLDDIFSELDHSHRELVMTLANNHASEGGQVIMTTTEEEFIPHDGWKKIEIEG